MFSSGFSFPGVAEKSLSLQGAELQCFTSFCGGVYLGFFVVVFLMVSSHTYTLH